MELIFAEYINRLSIALDETHYADDRPILEKYLSHSAIILSRIILKLPLLSHIENYKRLLGHTWLRDEKAFDLLYKQWENFKSLANKQSGKQVMRITSLKWISVKK